MTAAYMKEQVTAHYYGDSGQSARVYTIGVDVDECDAPALAYAYLDPAQTVPSHFSATDGDKKDPDCILGTQLFLKKSLMITIPAARLLFILEVMTAEIWDGKKPRLQKMTMKMSR